MSRTTHALTVDVEDYFQVEALADVIDRADWTAWEPRVERNVERVLELMAAAGCRATFFTLGWIAERHPSLIRRIVAAGHELASHGFGHRRADSQSPAEFRADIRAAKRVLEDIGGIAVKGYRAPCFSINAATPWAFDIIAEEGYCYSSSVYPGRGSLPGLGDTPFRAGRHGLLEIPLTTARLLGRPIPAAGGGFFRLFPYPLSRWLLSRAPRTTGAPCVFYFHPWEIDPGQPRVAGLTLKSRMRHYLHLGRLEGRLRRLLSDFAWDRLDHVYRIAEGSPHDRPDQFGRHHHPRDGQHHRRPLGQLR